MNPENADADVSDSTPANNSHEIETSATTTTEKKTDVADAFNDLFNN
jgi:hypothetical protein